MNSNPGVLKKLADIVRRSRERTAAVFPLPDFDDCLDYAITEAAEYLDAVLRAKRAGDKRNNDKQHDPRSEWGQCGYMIASAVIQDNTDYLDIFEWGAYASSIMTSEHDVIRFLCAIRSGESEATQLEHPAIDALDKWHAFAVRCDWHPAVLLRETCEAFEAKHLPEEA